VKNINAMTTPVVTAACATFGAAVRPSLFIGSTSAVLAT